MAAGRGVRARSRRRRSCSIAPPAGPVAIRPGRGRGAALKAAGWTEGQPTAGICPRRKAPLDIELLSPDRASNPVAFAAAEAVAHDWRRSASASPTSRWPPATFVTDRLATGDVQRRRRRRDDRPRPGPLPAAGVEPDASTGGSNVIGLQDPALDKLLVAARGPGTAGAREAAYAALQKAARRRAATCSRWPSPTSRSWSATRSRDRPSAQVADPADRFWDVLTWRLAAGR